jgi:hypothetical protein
MLTYLFRHFVIESSNSENPSNLEHFFSDFE